MAEKSSNPLLRLREFGQSVWLDFLSRELMESGELERMIEEDGVCGVTTNPTIFERAISESADYDAAVERHAREGKKPEEICEAIVVEEVQRAADLLRPVYDRLDGRDGFVSLEVSPHLAHDDDATLAEARHLWRAVDRPNAMIKVPATDEAIPVIRQLISEGINVNVTLLFSLPRYHKIAEAYLQGLEARAAAGEKLGVASVASFFVSRIDTLIDIRLEEMIQAKQPNAEAAMTMLGRIAIACAKSAYEMFQTIFGTLRFNELAGKGALPQRLLWASTGTKNRAYSDVMYVEELIGPNTVNTMPVDTLNAYRDHGEPTLRLEENMLEAANRLQAVSELGISLEDVARDLEHEGIHRFAESYDGLIRTIQTKAAALVQA